jgi:parallel beta-helix repeat protein
VAVPAPALDPYYMQGTRRPRAFFAAALTIAATLALVPAAEACTRVASPAGSDSAAGTEAAPFRSAQKLASSVGAGETGCLRAGSYPGGATFRAAGRADAPVRFRNYPGERATVEGRVYVAKTAPHVVVEGLYLNSKAAGGPSPTVNASHVTFRHNDVTNDHTGICFLLGDSNGVYGRADHAVIEENRVHNCGKLPATNLDHGIYVESTTGARIEGNWLFNNADYGVHLYPDAQQTVVKGNMIDGNGMGVTISGDEGMASNDNVVEGNVITNPKLRYNVESWWPNGNPVPRGNVVRRNCLKAGGRDDDNNGGIELSPAFVATGNPEVADPAYADRGAKDLRLRKDSLCRGVFAGNPEAVPGPDGISTALPTGGPGSAPVITLVARRTEVPQGRPVPLRGQVKRARVKRGRVVRLYARIKGRRKLVGRARLTAAGRFAAAPRLRKLRIRGKVVRLQAVVQGIGRSRTVRVRIVRR